MKPLTQPRRWRAPVLVLAALVVAAVLIRGDLGLAYPLSRQKPDVELEYDKIISTGFIGEHYALKWWEHVEAAYPSAQRWLEAGCGECGLLKKLLDDGKDAYGVEVSEVAVQRGCGDLPAQGRVKQSSLEAIPFPANHFDVVFSSEVLEHIPEAAVPKVVKELCRVSTGKLFLSISLRRSVHDPPAPAKPSVHVSVKARSWWDEQFRQHAGCVPDADLLHRELRQRGKKSFILVHQLRINPAVFAYSCPTDCVPEELR